jgi:hypothetical protein
MLKVPSLTPQGEKKKRRNPDFQLKLVIVLNILTYFEHSIEKSVLTPTPKENPSANSRCSSLLPFPTILYFRPSPQF